MGPARTKYDSSTSSEAFSLPAPSRLSASKAFALQFRVGHLAGVMLLLCLGPQGRVSAQSPGDYDPESHAWNGMATLREVFAEEQSELLAPSSLSLEELSPQDSLLIVYPRQPLPVASLAAFMRDGGRIALADDFGRGDELLDVYRIQVREPSTGGAAQLRGNRSLPIAVPRAPHVLAEGVGALATNHPRVFRHEALEPLFAFDGESADALLLAGAVGEGRLVALADPSVLINNMLRLRDNRQFASNLAHYLADAGGRAYLVGPNTELLGTYGDAEGDTPFAGLKRWIADAAQVELPPLALQIATFALVLALAIFALSTLPRQSPYDGKSMFARPQPAGGFVGRVGFFSRRGQNLLHPTLVYKYELEGEIVRRLGLGESALLRDVVAALGRRGLSHAEVGRARALLLALDALREKQDHPPSPPRVGPERFHELVREGEHLLERIDPTSSPR